VRIAERSAQFAFLPAQDNEDQADRQGEDRAPADELERGNAVQSVEIDRQQPPDQIGAASIG
jgi:hypothetical protein